MTGQVGKAEQVTKAEADSDGNDVHVLKLSNHYLPKEALLAPSPDENPVQTLVASQTCLLV